MRQVITATAVALALSVGVPALAQQAGQQNEQQQQSQQQAKLSADADNIVGKEAKSQQGKDLGKVKDVLVGQDGKVQAMIVDYDGKDRAVPWEQAQLQGDQVTIKMSEQQMSQLPEYESKKD